MLTAIITFFQGMTIDRGLAIASCIIGIVAIFVGGKAYHKSKHIENSFNDGKEFKDNSVDNSQKAETIINNNADTKAIVAITTSNFETALKTFSENLEKRNIHNTKEILEKVYKIINEKKINIREYTKIDWITVYLENVKNTADTYMQNVWANILVKELENPDSFSFQTLDIVRKMTGDDFRTFEYMCSFALEEFVFTDHVCAQYGFEWDYMVRMKEVGLLNLEETSRIYRVEKHNHRLLLSGKSYLIGINNEEDTDIEITISGFTLTKSAIQLHKIVDVDVEEADKDYILYCVNLIDEQLPDSGYVSLHDIVYNSDGDICGREENLLETEEWRFEEDARF